jgi:hypothetical protein
MPSYVMITISDADVDMPNVDRMILHSACSALGYGVSSELLGLVNARNETSKRVACAKLRAKMVEILGVV